MLFVLLRYRLALPYAYYLFSSIISVFIVIMIYRWNEGKRRFIYLSIAVLCIFLRSVYPIASGFSVIPLIDGYTDYSVARIFLESGRSNVTSLFSESAWPLLHILAVSLSQALNLDILYVVLVVPLIFSALILAFIYLLTKEIVEELGVNQRVIPLALLIYAISPDNIYSSMQYIRQNFAVVFIMIILYLTFKYDKTKDARVKLLLILFSVTLVLVHHLGAFMTFLFFSLFFFLKQTGNSFLGRFKWKISQMLKSSISLGLIILFLTTMFAWWIYYSPIVLTTYLPWLTRISSLRLYTGPIEYALTRWSFYTVLRPYPYTNLLMVRDIAEFVPPAIGFLAYFKWIRSKRELTITTQFLLYSVTAFVAILAIFTFALNIHYHRVLIISACFLALFSALFYGRLFSNKHRLWRIVSVSVMITAIFLTFLSPFSRGIFPRYLYDSSISFEDVGNHNPRYIYVVPFVKDHMQIENFETAASDDPELLYVVLPTKSYSSVTNLYLYPELINGSRVIIFSFLHLNPSYSWLPYIIQSSNVTADTGSFKRQITDRFNSVYDDGYSRILISTNQSQT